MRHRTRGGDTKFAVGDGTSGSGTAADIGSACPVNGAVIALCTARAEFHHSASVRCAGNTAGFGSNQRLVVNGEQHHRFDKLCLNGGTAHGDDRLIREDRRAFGYRPHVAAEFKVGEIVQKRIAEQVFAAQIVNIFGRELQVGEIVYKLFHTRHNGITAVVRHTTEEHIKIDDRLTLAAFQKAVSHRQLVKVRKHCQIVTGVVGIHTNNLPSGELTIL